MLRIIRILYFRVIALYTTGISYRYYIIGILVVFNRISPGTVYYICITLRFRYIDMCIYSADS